MKRRSELDRKQEKKRAREVRRIRRELSPFLANERGRRRLLDISDEEWDRAQQEDDEEAAEGAEA